MKSYCTYFDKHYLVKGLTLFRSLCEHSPDFKLYVLCFDDYTHQVLSSINLSNLLPIALNEFEDGDVELLRAKAKRSRLEYYFTCTPSLPLYILRKFPATDLITYLDADLFFYSSPEPMYTELGDGSILIIELRHPPHWTTASQLHGNFNVGFITFRNDVNAINCLEWWRERCLEWCYNKAEDGKFGDQKYLDEWPALFSGVVISKHKGANLAFWNWMNYKVTCDDGKVFVDGEYLIFCHLSRVRQINRFLFALNYDHPFSTPRAIRRCCYFPYVRAVKEAEQWLSGKFPEAVRDYLDLRSKSDDWKHFIKSAFRGNIVVSVGGRIF